MEPKSGFNTEEIAMLEQFFEELSTADKRKVFLAGFRKASKVYLDTVRPQLPRRTGNLQKSLGTQAVAGNISLIAGAFRGSGKKGWHAHLIENGTKERFRKSKNNAPTGRMVADPIFEKSYSQREMEMLKQIHDEWYDTICQFGIKYFKKMSK